MERIEPTLRQLPDQDRLDRLLDEALAATFPASDPVAIGAVDDADPAFTQRPIVAPSS
jgi:hypothetical protein